MGNIPGNIIYLHILWAQSLRDHQFSDLAQYSKMTTKKIRYQKRRSKRIISKAKNVKNAPTKKINIAIRSSERITKKLLQLDSHEKEKGINVARKPVENITSRPVRQQFLNLPIELTCADLERQVCDRLGIFSCFCCDNYREDRACLLKKITSRGK